MDVEATIPPCRICGNQEGNRAFNAREMMFGLRDRFDYMECGACACLQLLDPPADWSRYYPDDYAAFAPRKMGVVKRVLRGWRARYALGRRSILGWLLVKRWGRPQYVEWINTAGVRFDDAILDVGCGGGHLLADMADAGFTNLTGIDPNVSDDIDAGANVSIHQGTLAEVESVFDFVMMHHSFEHMAEPVAELTAAARVLKPGGTLLIRIPVAGTFAWRHYGADWVQLDAPRHVFLHTEASVRALAKQAGLTVQRIRYDSAAFQFWGSELYKEDIALTDARAPGIVKADGMFSHATMAEFARRATALNQKGDGDQACFYLAHA